MKVKSGFVLHTVANEHVVVAVEERTIEFHGMIRLNGTGAFLWKKLQEEVTAGELEAALIEEYGIDTDTAHEAVASFVGKLTDAGVMQA